ncbi:MAG: FKBP-type peptidyl-prolyl cis-trans isomerase [Flavobacteriales bacterium]|nr:FKBP-type peptidyl-prolyl cis-trans isomerase [Flavobacteriales bacterium]MCX7650208.1 FKBP-type peptidyl-prolyl cis-trans isomerase [Flavobacteriales bacterium]MDW8432284.1 FKBP-type peptidyl-prolyl cis-trans isomerase [Flavobacteriales bacterium]
MNRLFLTLTALGILFSCTSQGQKGDQPKAKPENKEQRLSYAIGKDIGSSLRSNNIKPNLEYLMEGIRHGLENAGYLMTEQEMAQALQEYQQDRMREMQEQANREAGPERAKGEEFLTNNRQRKEVKETPSGLQYEVIKEGSGPKPTATNTVKVYYRGTLIDGTEFDATKPNKPVEFRLDQVIKGWTEGLQLMSKGSKYKLYIPADLAYGNNPPPGSNIKPGSTLIFEVELLDFK